jgi:hypothetical protein
VEPAPDTPPFQRTGIVLGVLARILRGVVPVIVLAAATIVLGLVGYSQIPGETLSASDTLYRTLQLFNLEAEIPATGTPWQLELARFLGPLTVAYAVLVALLAVARDRLRRWWTRLFASRHVLIIGIGARGSALARALRSRWRVVALELDAASGAARSLRESGVTVFNGDGRDPDTLRAVRAHRAAHVVVLTTDDSTNLEVLAALKTVIGAADPVPIHVAVDAPALWAELHRLPFQGAAHQRRVEFISIPDRVARLVIEAAIAAWSPRDGRPRLLVPGSGPTVARLVVQLLRSSLSGDRPVLIVEGEDAEENLRILRTTDRWVFERAEVRLGDPGDFDLEVAAGFVCGLGEADALDAAVTLIRRMRGDARVYAAVPDADVGAALTRSGVDLARVELVPTSERVLGELLLEGAAFERMARGRHDDYLLQARRRGEDPASNDALRPWDELDEKYRQANRRFIDGISEILVRLDAHLVPLSGREVGELPLSDETVEELAVAEHERWRRDQLSDGWRPTDAPEKDPERKLHPMLRPWDELPETEREKDRDAIRALPQLLASVGYELVVADEAPG